MINTRGQHLARLPQTRAPFTVDTTTHSHMWPTRLRWMVATIGSECQCWSAHALELGALAGQSMSLKTAPVDPALRSSSGIPHRRPTSHPISTTQNHGERHTDAAVSRPKLEHPIFTGGSDWVDRRCSVRWSDDRVVRSDRSHEMGALNPAQTRGSEARGSSATGHTRAPVAFRNEMPAVELLQNTKSGSRTRISESVRDRHLALDFRQGRSACGTVELSRRRALSERVIAPSRAVLLGFIDPPRASIWVVPVEGLGQSAVARTLRGRLSVARRSKTNLDRALWS